MILLVLLAQFSGLNQQPLLVRDEGAAVAPSSRAHSVNCVGAGVTCAQDGGIWTMTVSGSGSGGAPVDAGYIVLSGHSSGSTNERTLSAGNYTSIDTGTAGQVQVDWAHGLTCSSGQSLTSSGTSALVCTSTITASDVACAGTCVSSSEISSVSGSVVSGAVPTASALASDPTACTAGQYVSDVSAAGVLTCGTPAGTYVLPDATSIVTGGVRLTGDLGGTATSPSVVDDSHNHTSSTVSGLDVADITTGTLPLARGGTGVATAPDDNVLVGSGSAWVSSTVPDCDTAATSKLLYDQATNAFSCGTDQTSAGGGAPTDATYITQTANGTLTNEQALSTLTTGLVKVTNGTGALSTAVSGTDYEPAGTYSGVGACAANTWASTLNDGAAPTCTQPSFSSVSGTVAITQGGTGVTSRADDDIVIGTGANTTATTTLPSCSTNTSALTYNTTTNTFSCNSTFLRATSARLTSDYTNSTTTGTEVTGLQTSLNAGTWKVEFWLRLRSAATTTGFKFGVNFTGTLTTLLCTQTHGTTGAAAATGVMDGTAAVNTGSLVEANSTRAASTTAPNLGPNAGVDTANTDVFSLINCIIVTGGNGDLELWAGSEVAASQISVMSNSFVTVTAIP